MRNFVSWKSLAIILLISGILIAAWALAFGGYLQGNALTPDSDKAKEIHPFITGLVLPLLTLGSTLLIFENLRASTLQNFSNNFFKLIDQHHKLIDNINTVVDPISTLEIPSKGRAFFDDLAQRISNDYYGLSDPKFAQENDVLDVDEELRKRTEGQKGKELFLTIYDYHFHIHQSDLGHYYRNLYHIIRYVERSSLGLNSQKQFVKMLRAQLSNYEILLLAYNGMHFYGEKFRPLIEKFELIKNLNTEERLTAERSKRIIPIVIIEETYPHFKRLNSTR